MHGTRDTARDETCSTAGAVVNTAIEAANIHLWRLGTMCYTTLHYTKVSGFVSSAEKNGNTMGQVHLPFTDFKKYYTAPYNSSGRIGYVNL